MNECVKHRGPNEEGYFREEPVGLAHRRLSIIGIESGRQPIFNEDESIAVIFNGEIYNYTELRESLVRDGHRFSTDTDTEVLVHLYEEEGDAFVDRLEGMFAFALWDRDDERLLLARDPRGIKPLFVGDDGDHVAFGSELRSLLASPIDQGPLDKNAISQYFALGYIPAPNTVFENVRSLLPGQLYTIEDSDSKSREFTGKTIQPRDVSFDTATTELRERMTAAVEKRLMSDVPLGAFLSGGIDSTIIVGLMSELSSDPVQTFSVRFGEELFDESSFARTVAEYHDTDHHEFTVSPETIRESIPHVVSKLGQPFGDPSLLPTYIVSNRASDEVTVTLSGDGADELFAGYNRYVGEYYSSYYRKIPRTLRTSLIKPALESLPATRSNEFGEMIRKGQRFVATNADETAERHYQLVRRSDDSIDDVYTGYIPEKDGLSAFRDAHEDARNALPKERQDSLSRILAVDMRFGLPNQMLQKVDTASMLNSLEVRVPFLDQSVVNYALGLPTEYKITRRSRKRVLKAAFDDLLPNSILNREKQGFDMPIGEWFKNELADEFEESITGLETELLDSQRILEIHREHVTGSRDYERFLWNAFVFAQWERQMRAEGFLEIEDRQMN
ncbi:asparagine synthase (glutamine-hydrolysing) [Halopiger aswanensis]|uniref:Putative asparagine synthetase [glutamine-hydrolyzing] n=2 Tax=Halopiger aswanensis TaxID=148449 RepID=A0A3R7DFN6_9EURY|nr:asparagine synthase (glutamine-hydrolysing) [Halopiger aswanensis]